MKKLIFSGLILGCSFLIATTSLAQDASTVVGEVVDLDCYVANGSSGPGHASCAKSCIQSGKPMGLLTESGDVVLLVPGDHTATLTALAGEKAEVKGKKSEKGGITMLVVTEAKKASS